MNKKVIMVDQDGVIINTRYQITEDVPSIVASLRRHMQYYSHPSIYCCRVFYFFQDLKIFYSHCTIGETLLCVFFKLRNTERSTCYENHE